MAVILGVLTAVGMKLIEPYDARPVEFLDLWVFSDWKVKAYGITYRDARPGAALIQTAREMATAVFPEPAVTANRYGCGFAGIHQGRGANFLFFCWWENENELLHRVFVGSGNAADGFSEQTAQEVRACVWDIAVIAYEREAWIRHVLDNPAGPDIDAYLSDRLRTVV
jgi:hypothetical protein